MQWLWCCDRVGAVRPAPIQTPDLVADLPHHARDSTPIEDKDEKEKENVKSIENLFVIDGSIDNVNDENGEENVQRSRTPSMYVEDVSEKSIPSIISLDIPVETSPTKSIIVEKQENTNITETDEPANESLEANPASAKSSQVTTTPSKSSITSNISATSVKTTNTSPEPSSHVERLPERDVRSSLAECIMPARHEDWEAIVSSLLEIERLAKDEIARAPAASWRAVTRSVATHVRSLRSRVARAGCSSMAALFEHRGRCLDPELEEATSALLDRCADVNRFLRADATVALGRVACGGNCARAGVALVRRGVGHRAGPVRAAAAQALTKLVRQQGPTRILDLPTEPRVVILRAAGELLGDASADARLHARHLCLALGEDSRFQQMLKDAMPSSRYRAIEKYVDKLRCR